MRWIVTANTYLSTHHQINCNTFLFLDWDRKIFLHQCFIAYLGVEPVSQKHNFFGAYYAGQLPREDVFVSPNGVWISVAVDDGWYLSIYLYPISAFWAPVASLKKSQVPEWSRGQRKGTWNVPPGSKTPNHGNLQAQCWRYPPPQDRSQPQWKASENPKTPKSSPSMPMCFTCK